VAEQIFFNKPLLLLGDLKHSRDEPRFHALGITNDSTEHLDWSKAKNATFPNLKPSTKTISLRLPEDVIR
jgi:uncharacterized DUF497 family protein